jgi:hypothetical protein
MTMKKTHSKIVDDLRPEYRFNYNAARSNRFAPDVPSRSSAPVAAIVVTLDPDIAEVFTTAEEVNAVLRALIETMPPSAKRPSRAA